MAPIKETSAASRPPRTNRRPGLSPELIHLLRGNNDSTWKRPAYRVKPLTPFVRNALVSSLKRMSRNSTPFRFPDSGRAFIENELYIECKYSAWCDGRPVRKRDVTNWLKRQPFAQMINDILAKQTRQRHTPSIEPQHPVRDETVQSVQESNQTVSEPRNEDEPCASRQAVESNAEEEEPQPGRSRELMSLPTRRSPGGQTMEESADMSETTEPVPTRLPRGNQATQESLDRASQFVAIAFRNGAFQPQQCKDGEAEVERSDMSGG